MRIIIYRPDRKMSPDPLLAFRKSAMGGIFRSERFRRQFHCSRASALDAREMHRSFGQHPFHEEAARHQLGGQIRSRSAACNLVLSYFRHPPPHIAEGYESE